MMAGQMEQSTSLPLSLRALALPSFVAYHTDIAVRAEKEGWSFAQYLSHLAELELGERRNRRVERLLRASNLPPDNWRDSACLT